MASPTLERIEADIEQLPLADQRRLMQRLAERIHANRTLRVQEHELAAMANDPAIQQELQRIDAEFASTEADGLGATP